MDSPNKRARDMKEALFQRNLKSNSYDLGYIGLRIQGLGFRVILEAPRYHHLDVAE